MTTGPEWLDPVGDEVRDRDAGRVQAALLTTYEPPDATLLVEDLLPRWFQLDREASSEGRENRFFLVELEEALQQRRGKLSVFSSNAVVDAASRHWVWSYVVPHRVGARGATVQHAKLWLLHRVNDNGDECLDIHVSSTNLTRSASRDQVQAGFRYRAPLEGRVTQVALRSWGALVPFLGELGAHAGSSGEAAVAPWRDLLGRCRAPKGVTFVASVPGVHAGADWGVRALGAALSLPNHGEVDILVPTVGEWTGPQIEAWAKAVGTRPERIRLAWVAKEHPWERNWSMSESSVTNLREAGPALLDLGDAKRDQRQRISKNFHRSDERWPHAKVYWFERGSTDRVLVTSANWSTSAWGAVMANGRLRIGNFELGVLLSTKTRPLRTLKEMSRPPATATAEREFEETALWAHATFDGRLLRTLVRIAGSLPRTVVAIDADEQRTELSVQWKRVGELRQATSRHRWRAGPAVIIVEVKGISHWIPVQDLRDDKVARQEPLGRPPGISAEELKALRAALLEERYGGQIADDALPSGSAGEAGPDLKGPKTSGDYGVWVMEQARRVLAVVDYWSAARAEAASDSLRAAINRDGQELLRLWRHQCEQDHCPHRVALVVACDELGMRLKRPL